MRNLLFVLFAVAFLASCTSTESTTETTGSVDSTTVTTPSVDSVTTDSTATH